MAMACSPERGAKAPEGMKLAWAFDEHLTSACADMGARSDCRRFPGVLSVGEADVARVDFGMYSKVNDH
jgi:hypothetical protein